MTDKLTPKQAIEAIAVDVPCWQAVAAERERLLAECRAECARLREALKSEADNLAKDAYFCTGGEYEWLRRREDRLRAALVAAASPQQGERGGGDE